MPDQLKILIVDDDEGDRAQIRRVLRQARIACVCTEAESVAAALARGGSGAFDLAIVDYVLPGTNGLGGIVALRELMPDLSVIMATGSGDETVAVEAMRLGAEDYILKSRIQPEVIKRVIAGALEKAALRRAAARQREELERFAAVLAHDLKAPITSICGFARLAEADLHAERIDRPRLALACGRIAAAVQRMQTLIDTLYAYTRLDAKIQFKPIEMAKVVDGILIDLRDQIGARRAQVTCEDLPWVTGDAAQLGQLLQNLIANGIKYCTAAVPHIHIAAVKRNEKWLFTVRDNGIGIPLQSRRAIFEAFTRLHDRNQYEGTGLGLATCRKIVERHGGEIWCESDAGSGSTFCFTLAPAPACAPAEVA